MELIEFVMQSAKLVGGAIGLWLLWDIRKRLGK